MFQEKHPDFTAWVTIKKTFEVLTKDTVFFGVMLFLFLAATLSPFWFLFGIDPSNTEEITTLIGNNGEISYTSLLYYFLYAYFYILILDRVNARMNGHSFDDYPYIGRALKTIIPVIFLYICSGILVMFGFVLLIIPGLIAIAGLYLVIPAKLAENSSVWSAIPRGWELTKGHKLGIWGLILLQVVPIYGLLYFYMLQVLEAIQVSQNLEPLFSTMTLIIMVIIGGVLPVFYMASSGVAYHLIVNEKISDH